MQGAALGYRRKVGCGTSSHQGRGCLSDSVGGGRAIQAGRGRVELGMDHVTGGKAEAEDLVGGGRLSINFGLPSILRAHACSIASVISDSLHRYGL